MSNKFERATILLVDDEPANLQILMAALREQYNLLVAKNGKEALVRARGDSTPDLILMDVEMPLMSGYEACKALKEDDKLCDIPLIFITVLSAEEDETTGFSLGAVDYITKPFSPSVVRARVSTQLELKRHRDNLEALAEERAQQLIHAERLATLGSMAAGIVHEINNPLLYVSLSTEMLQREFDRVFPLLLKNAEHDPEDKKQVMSFLEESQNYINSAAEGVSRVNEIMTSMKNFSRRDVEDKSAVSIATCIQNSLNLCNNELKYHVEVITNIPDQLPPVYGIGRQLEQVFINLFHNAGQAMESFKNSGQRGMLSISVQPAGDSLRITVEDSGPGIPEESLSTIWNAFYTTKPAEAGTGLGLSISKGIIQNHLGHIRAENREQGGARFVLELPIANEEPSTDASTEN